MTKGVAITVLKAAIANNAIEDVNSAYTYMMALGMAIKALEQDKWIPVSERYPEEEGEEYLVCYGDGTIRIRNLYFTVADNEPYFEYGQGIVAWMPLPKPTVAEGSEE